MTGFGKADAHFEGKKIHVEVRTLNSKTLDVNVRLSPLYREKEMEIRSHIAASVVRGKVDLTLWTEKDAEQSAPTINPSVVASYVTQIEEISAVHHLPMPDNVWDLIVRLPETTVTSQPEVLTDEEWTVVVAAVDEALDKLRQFRQQEGEALAVKFEEKLTAIDTLLQSIAPYEQSRVEKIRARLESRLAELKGVDYDKNRLEQELIYYIEKLDISEEKQRLTNHLRYFRETMAQDPGQGKKLGFIAQEMGREINTTGSKSNQAEMQNIVVHMKDELEQIKEQVLNVM